ncbi:MAG TPA: M20/M25/M40 family metallo-hydrolase [Phycisphaerae bacterium]
MTREKILLSALSVSASSFLLNAVGAEPAREHDPQLAMIVEQIDSGRIQATILKLASFGTRHTLSDPENPARGIGAARRWIESEFRAISEGSGGRLEVRLDGYRQRPDGRRVTRPVEIVNIVATLRGTQPESADRIYIISGHYDSICSDPKDSECDAPGANDDASGVAAVLEMARVMSPHEFEATLVFMAVAGEEQGLYGSTYMARQAKARDWDVQGMITLDIVGSSTGADGTVDKGHVRVFSEGVPETEDDEARKTRLATGNENDSAARQLARWIDESAELYVPQMDVVLIWRRDRFLRGGDHTPFAREGFPAVRMTEINEDYRHQHQNVRVENGVQFGDLPQFVDFEYVANVARVNAATLASLALAPAAPKNAHVMTAKLTTDTTLRWNSNTEPDLAGFEIVWRETTAPLWQHQHFVGNVTEFTSPLSKDNFIFGVRAVDRNGHRSVVTYPLPAKE